MTPATLRPRFRYHADRLANATKWDLEGARHSALRALELLDSGIPLFPHTLDRLVSHLGWLDMQEQRT